MDNLYSYFLKKYAFVYILHACHDTIGECYVYPSNKGSKLGQLKWKIWHGRLHNLCVIMLG